MGGCTQLLGLVGVKDLLGFFAQNSSQIITARFLPGFVHLPVKESRKMESGLIIFEGMLLHQKIVSWSHIIDDIQRDPLIAEISASLA